jgi:putative ABC transport system permease protein
MPRLLIRVTTVLAIACAVAVLVLLPWWMLVALVVVLGLWMLLTQAGRQAWSVTELAIATLPQRLSSSSVIVLGIAGVVCVLVALLAMAAGFQATLQQTGTEDTAIIMRAGSQTEMNSVIDQETAQLVDQAPQVLRDAQGRPIASPELVVVVAIPERGSGLDANVELRGVGERAWDLRPNVRIIAGRRFRAGLRELVVGKRAHQQFAQTDVGSVLSLNRQPWTVVGIFDSGDAHDSELWGDSATIASTYRRGDSVTSISLGLTSAGAFDAYKAAITHDPRLKVDVKRTRDFYSSQSESLAQTIRILGATVGAIMGIGAVFGALNTMYAAVAARTREIATLRAIGFQGVPVIVSVLIETMLLAVLGGVIGAALAWLLFDDYTTSTLGENFSQVVFNFKVSPALLWEGLKWALAIGLIGGLFPAVRAARFAVTSGLREL